MYYQLYLLRINIKIIVPSGIVYNALFYAVLKNKTPIVYPIDCTLCVLLDWYFGTEIYGFQKIFWIKSY